MRSLGFVALALVACGGDSKTKDAAASGDAAHDAKPIDARQPDAPLDGPPGTQPLTVKNVLAWCSVSVGSGSASSAGVQRVFEAPGPITLRATAVSGFRLDAHMWHDTDGDTGSGEAGSGSGSASIAIVTVPDSTSKCVWVCCPFPDGHGCPTADQCP